MHILSTHTHTFGGREREGNKLKLMPRPAVLQTNEQATHDGTQRVTLGRMVCQLASKDHFFEANDLFHGRCVSFILGLLKIHFYVKALHFRSDFVYTGGRDQSVWEYTDR